MKKIDSFLQKDLLKEGLKISSYSKLYDNLVSCKYLGEKREKTVFTSGESKEYLNMFELKFNSESNGAYSLIVGIRGEKTENIENNYSYFKIFKLIKNNRNYTSNRYFYKYISQSREITSDLISFLKIC